MSNIAKINEEFDDNYYSKLKVFFKSSIIILERLKELQIKKQEIIELRDKKGAFETPIVITLSGTPRAGKTTCINNLLEFLRKANLKTKCLEEPAGIIYSRLKNKEEKQELLSDRIGFIEQQYSIGEEYINKNLDGSDIILCDRGIIDPFIWYDMYYHLQMMDEKRYMKFLEKMKNKVNYINRFYALYASTYESMSRDYLSSLSIEPRTTMNEQNIERYNSSLLRVFPLIEKQINYAQMIDTTKNEIMDTSVIIANDILDEVKRIYLRRI